ncbi:MAG: restriction endonuclease subunit S [Prevotella sp.]|nr:restriction endonuclease subunit S [Prevotella sp.]
MKEGWEYKKLGEVIEHLRTGLNPRTHFKLNTPDAEGYYVTVRELKGFAIEPDEKTDKVNKSAIKRINERSNLKIGDVLFSGTGTIGKTALVTELPENWNIKEGVYAMTPKHSELDSKYFIYYIGSDLFLRLVNDKAAGTGVRSIPMKELVKLPISVPPLSEQQSIVDYLDSAFAKIDAMKANAEKALNEAKALFQASLKEMLEPKEGWEEKTLRETCSVITDGTHHSPVNTANGKYKYVTAKNIKPWGLDLRNITFVSEDVHKEIVSRCCPQKGDVLYIKDGATTGIAIVNPLDEEFSLLSSVALIRPNKNIMLSEYLCYALNSPSIYEQTRSQMDGAAITRVTLVKIKGFTIPLPPLSEQQYIVATLDSFKSKVDRLQANYDKISQECDALKQAILRQVFE